jgi:hypothetical protein
MHLQRTGSKNNFPSKKLNLCGVPTEGKIVDVKDSFYEELERVYNKFP